jgi:transcriptional regulator with XRE-family HTH domain
MDDLTKQLAINLRLIREGNNYSLDDIAGKTGVSKSMLRQIERGESSPSISTVWKIANGLKISFTTLLTSQQEPISVVGFLDNEPLVEKDSGYRLFPLFPFQGDRKFEVYYIEIDRGARLDSDGHAGRVEEYVFVFSGGLRITVNGEDHDIGTAQAMRFDASEDHGYSNARDETARAIMIIYYGLK